MIYGTIFSTFNYINPIRTEAVSPRRRATINACHNNMNERIGLFFLDFSSKVFHQILIHSVFQYLYKILRNHVQKIGGTLQFWVCSQIWCCLRTNLGQIGPNFWSGRPNFWNLTQCLFFNCNKIPLTQIWSLWLKN